MLLRGMEAARAAARAVGRRAGETMRARTAAVVNAWVSSGTVKDGFVPVKMPPKERAERKVRG